MSLNLFKMKNITILFSIISFLLTISANGQTNSMEIDEFIKKIASERYMLIDVRTVEEFEEGYIQGAVNIDYYSTDFANQIEKIANTTPVLLYCRSGNRSGKAAKIMDSIGFYKIYE